MSGNPCSLYVQYVHNVRIESFHLRGQQQCKFIGTKESVCIRKEFNSQRIGLGQQHGRRFIVLGHRCDVMGKHSIKETILVTISTLRQGMWVGSLLDSQTVTRILYAFCLVACEQALCLGKG